MRLRTEVNKLPEGDTAYSPPVSATVRLIADSSTVTTVAADANGWIDLQRDGHLAPYYLHITGVPGGDKFLRSDDVKTAGVLPLKELQIAMRTLGDGVVRGYGSELATSLGVDSVAVADGAANVVGHPFVVYTASTNLAFSRPVSSTRIDRVIIRLYPEGSATTPGKADLALLAGTEGGAAPTLTQTTTVYEISLAQVSIPVVGTPTLTDERDFTNEVEGFASSISRSDVLITTSGAGASLASFSLTLPLAQMYDVDARVGCLQADSTSVMGWVLQASYGPTFNSLALSTIGQVAVDSTGRILIADTTNSRLVILTSAGAYSTGITSLTGIIGVCTDSSDNIYVFYDSAAPKIRKYSSALALQATKSTGGAATDVGHLTTDSTNVYFTEPTSGNVCSVNVALSSSVSVLAGPGTGDGQFTNPLGIIYASSLLYVVDRRASDRAQVLNTSGVYQRKWTINNSDTTAYAINADASGDIFVSSIQAFESNGTVRHTTNAGVAIDSFTVTGGAATGLGVASGDVVWLTNDTTHLVEKWDEGVTSGGYGEIAVSVNGNLSTYVGPGNRDASIANRHIQSVQGPASCTIALYGKALANTLTLREVLLSARAKARR